MLKIMHASSVGTVASLPFLLLCGFASAPPGVARTWLYCASEAIMISGLGFCVVRRISERVVRLMLLLMLCYSTYPPLCQVYCRVAR